MSTPPQLAAQFSGLLYGPDRFTQMLEHVRSADLLGLDAVTTTSHVVMPPDPDAGQSGYRSFQTIRESDAEPPRNAPWLEVMTVLSAFAAVTSRVDVVSAIAIAPLYPAALLAKMAVTIDHLSQGRLRLGVTPSWAEGEYRALGVDFEHRGAILDETIAACQRLWAPGEPDSTVSFHGTHVQIPEVFFSPKAQGDTGIPVYFGGPLSARTLRRIVTMGEGWLPWKEPLGRLRDSVDAIRTAMSAAGRDPESLVVQYSLPPRDADGAPANRWGPGSLERSFETVPALLAAGATVVTIPLHHYCEDPDDAPDVLAHSRELWRSYVE